MTRLPGYSGACQEAYVKGDEPGIGSNKHQVKSLVVIEGLHPKLLIDGTYFMSFASGAIDGWIH